MSKKDIAPTQLIVRSSNPKLPRTWTPVLVSLTSEGIRYSPETSPEKELLLTDLDSIESIGNYGTGKAEYMFQVKSKGYTTLHKCESEADVQKWVDKVMLMGHEELEEDFDDDSDADKSDASADDKTATTASTNVTNDDSGTSEEETLASKAKDAAAASKSSKNSTSAADDKKSSKTKSNVGPGASSTPVKAVKTKDSSKDKSKDKASSKDKDKSKRDKADKKDKKDKKNAGTSTLVATPAKDNGKKAEDAALASRRSKSVSTNVKSNDGSYVPQFMAHYNGIKQAERQKQLESLSTLELVQLVSSGLELNAKAEREKVLQEWSAAKRAKLAELHAVERADMERKQARENDDVTKRFKEFLDQPI